MQRHRAGKFRRPDAPGKATARAVHARDRVPGWLFWGYNILLGLATLLVSPYFAWKLITVKKHRNSFSQRLGFYGRPSGNGPPQARSLWIHAVSVGELLATIPLLQRVRRMHRELPVAVSAVTLAAVTVARQRLRDAETIFYLPFDYPLPICRALRFVRPRLLVHTESELWPNLLFMLGRRGVPTAILNGRLSLRSCRRYGMFRFFYARLLRNVIVFGMQSREDGLRIIRIGADPRRVYVTGNMKFDIPGPEDSASCREALRKDLGFPEGALVLVAGSTHEGEEEPLLDALVRLKPDHPSLRVLLAPRHPDRCGRLEHMAHQRGLTTQRRTRRLGREGPLDEEVLLLDTIGELFRAYSIADVVFLGGTLVPIGGHNVLEPVWFRKPVLLGPWTEKIRDVVDDLRAARGVIVVRDEREMARELDALLLDPLLRREVGEAAFRVLRNHQGATERNLALLRPLLGDAVPGVAGPAQDNENPRAANENLRP